MMELHFLKAAEPLTKKFTLEEDGTYSKTPYPNAYYVSSMSIGAQSIEDFHTAVKAFSEQGTCLMKGELDRQLSEESRAGRTLANKATEWVVFDIDGLEGVESAEEFIQNVLPAPFHDASYVTQLSCSSGITGSGLRLHVFFLLGTPVAPAQLKRWLTECNLDTPVLRDQLRLGAGGMSLRFPLDRSVADNSKLIFIAPPSCANFSDPLAGSRISLVTKSLARVAFDFSSSSAEVISQKEREAVKTLRDRAGLEKQRYSVYKRGEFEVLRNADPVVVTDHWVQNGFIRLNLDGGDSGAYWVNPKRPEFIHNFKGEPSLVLRDVASEFWEEIKDQVGDPEMLVFRDIHTGRHFHGVFKADHEEIEWMTPIEKGDIDDWADDMFNASPPDPLPQYFLEFDPTDKRVIDRDDRFVNRFSPTEYMRMEPVEEGTELELPPVIGKVLRSVTGDDEECLDYFLNWLAFIFQRREKTGTAVVLHGVPGTGKGVLYSKVLRPLLGQYTREISLDRIERDTFNSFLDETLLINVDEAEANPKMRNQIFTWITDEYTTVRKAYQDQKDARTFCNFMFCSNHLAAVTIELYDRRFTVFPRQEERLYLTDQEVHEEIPRELRRFAEFLASWELDAERVRLPLETEAKEDMRDESSTSVGDFANAINNGDIAYFLEQMSLSEGLKVNHNIGVEAVLRRWSSAVNSSEPQAISQNEIHHMYQFVQQKDIPTSKFGHLLSHLGVRRRTTVEIDGKPVTGLYVEWTAEPSSLQRYKEYMHSKGVRAPSLSDDPADRAVLGMKSPE